MSKIILILFFYPLKQKKEHVPDTEVMCCSGSVTDSLTFISRLLVHHSSMELSHDKWVSTCGVTSHLNFAPD